MITMFLICGGLSTIIIIVRILSVYLARWAIKTDFGKMLAVIYSDPNEDIKNEYLLLKKEEILSEIVSLHYKLHNAITDKKFSYVQTLNTKIFIASCRLADIITNENITHI